MIKYLKRHYAYSIALASSVAGACSAAPSEPGQHASVSAAVTVIAPALKRVSAIRVEKGANTILQDEPATSNFEQLSLACRSGMSIGNVGLAMYQLELVPEANTHIAIRAAALGVSPSNQAVVEVVNATTSAPWAMMRSGAMRLQLNAFSGDETYADVELFHKGPGSKTTLMNEEYLARANAYLSAVSSSSRQIAMDRLYPYRVWRYVNAVSQVGGTPDETVYQVEVAYNDTIDDIPVIGSGGKIAVHMAVDGRVVEHEINVRTTAKKLRAIEWADITCPDNARAEVEDRLKTRGINPSQYKLARAEFGYLRLGRHSIQRVVAPHYAFIYEPLPGVMGKKLAETVPATLNSEIRSALADDDRLEENRKAGYRTRKIFGQRR